jgi:hypothetical protein
MKMCSHNWCVALAAKDRDVCAVHVTGACPKPPGLSHAAIVDEKRVFNKLREIVTGRSESA